VTDRLHTDPIPADPAEFSRNLSKLAEYSAGILADIQSYGSDAPAAVDTFDLVSSFAEVTAAALSDPQAVATSQLDWLRQYASVCLNVAARATGEDIEPAIAPERGDKRFRDPAWSEHPTFDFMKQSYLMASKWIDGELKQMRGVDPQTAHKVEFFTRQFIDAMAPSNFILTNPEVLRTTLDANAENLVRGMEQMRADLHRGKGHLAVSQADLGAFEVGKNIATSPGEVVFENDLMQLIQYAPSTETVYRRPLLIVPPWINKFYILDLKPENSFISWAVAQGYTVFVVSWVNPDQRLADKQFEDYMLEGPLAAVDAIEAATGEREVSTIGYCIGGTLLAATLAYMAAEGDQRITSATFFAAQVDFSEAGDLSVFTTEDQLRQVEKKMEEEGGVLDASSMATVFNLLRPNDLIWSNVVNQYLLGKRPPAFDLLYWNSDATRIPAAVHSFYLRNMYLENRLVQPGAVTLAGVPIDLGKVKTPMYVQASREDHIAPARSVYKMLENCSGSMKFMMAGSGHIAGVVNPPVANKYQYWTAPAKKASAGRGVETFDEWVARATEKPGSWWGDWHAWLSRRSGGKVPARAPGDGALRPIETAPGSYVMVRSDEEETRAA